MARHCISYNILAIIDTVYQLFYFRVVQLQARGPHVAGG